MYCFFLRIYNLQREDAGRYICMATNAIGTNQDYAHIVVDGESWCLLSFSNLHKIYLIFGLLQPDQHKKEDQF